MPKTTQTVRYVRHACAMACGIETRMPIGPCAHPRTRAHAPARLHPAHTAHTAHANTHAGLRVFAPRTGYPTYRTPKKMDCCNPSTLGTRVIRCTPDNAKEMQQIVKAWPALHALVQSLQAQNQFPGLRALQIELTGTPEQLAKGLGALQQHLAPKAE
jgi:hypothetical protein